MSVVTLLVGVLLSFIDSSRFEVFVRIAVPPSQAVVDRLRESGIEGYLIDARDDATLNAMKGATIGIENLVSPGVLRLAPDDFDRYFDTYVPNRSDRLTERPFCFNREPILSELPSEVGRLANQLRRFEPRFLSLVTEPSITLGSEPFDWCICQECLERWLSDVRTRHPLLVEREHYFGVSLGEAGSLRPWTVDRARARNEGMLLSDVILAPWVDHRAFMERELARVLRELVVVAREASGVPVGFLGGATTNPFGGHDWWSLAESSDRLLPPDDPTSREVVRSHPKGGELIVDLHRTGGLERVARRKVAEQFLLGARTAVARDLGELFDPPLQPSGGNPSAELVPSRLLSTIAPLLATLRGPAGSAIVHATPIPPRVGILYSPASAKVDWLRHATVDGIYWPGRSLRRGQPLAPNAGTWWGWQLFFDDIGLAYRYIGESELDSVAASNPQNRAGGDPLEGLDLVVLPRTIVLANATIERLRRFVASGGWLMIDSEAGLHDGGGNGRARGAFDDLFGIERGDESVWDELPTKRMIDAAGRLLQMGRPEPAIAARSPYAARHGAGGAVYLDVAMGDYLNLRLRGAASARTFATVARRWFSAIGLAPTAVVESADNDRLPGVRTFRFRDDRSELLALVVTADAEELKGARADQLAPPLSLRVTLAKPQKVDVLHGAAKFGTPASTLDVTLPLDDFVLLRLTPAQATPTK